MIDATHPYAARISHNAVIATEATKTPLVRLERSAWEKQPGDNWIDISGEAEAANAIPHHARVFLALGRQHIAPFAKRTDVRFVMRMIDPPEARCRRTASLSSQGLAISLRKSNFWRNTRSD